MQPQDLSTPVTPRGTRVPRKRSPFRSILPLVLLFLVVGGIAWLTQYLRNWREAPRSPAPVAGGGLLEFIDRDPLNSGPLMARWDRDDLMNFREFEMGTKGHYDFFCWNPSTQNVEVGLKTSSCDCASVQLALIPQEEWQKANEFQEKNLGSPLIFKQEPEWREVSADPKSPPILLKPKDHAVIRVQWNARKPPGQDLRLQPTVWWQSAGDSTHRKEQQFYIPGTMTFPLRCHPMRIVLKEILTAGARVSDEFDVWSPTRDNLDVTIATANPDPLLKVETKPLSPSECESMEKFFLANKIRTRVRCAYHVKVTAYESKDGKQMDQGVFQRKLHVFFDGVRQEEVPGPEIVGRVQFQDDFLIGGADDRGRIRFPSFHSRTGATKVVELSTAPKVQMEPAEVQPIPTLQVQLTRDTKNSNAERAFWRLKVTVPPNTFSGSFTDTDVVVLRIKGNPDRFMRIPIEGQVSGQ